MTHWSRRNQIVLLEQMEMCLSSGLTVGQTLESVLSSSRGKRAASILRIKEAFESGQSLSGSLKGSAGFPLAVIGLISCGESSGSLASALKASHSLLEQQDELIKKVLSAMAYPAVIGITAVVLTIGLVRGVMPQIAPLLAGLRVELPLLTRAVMAVSDFLAGYGVISGASFLVLIAVLVVIYKKFHAARKLAQRFFACVPVAGNLVINYHRSLFFRSFGSMVSAGIQADLAFEQAASSTTFIPLKEFLLARIPAIRAGGKFRDIAIGMPPYVSSLISAGEVSGSLGSSLLRVTSIISREIDNFLKKLTALVEPIMMVGMGGMVGSIALAIMMPIYDISKTLQR